MQSCADGVLEKKAVGMGDIRLGGVILIRRIKKWEDDRYLDVSGLIWEMGDS